MGVSVVPGKIRTAAGKINEAATESRNHKPDEIGGVADALPSSTSGPLASTLATTWGKRFGEWATAAADHATSMQTAADSWADTDVASRARAERQARMMDGGY
jgi:hypothetical protein